ncbi:hypothetical protein ACIQTT_15805 [Microbacterium sp. NPDC090225]|uniref:hypothetical protein n=1 Tax=Microbacterium sp. NPDC090225 TaxID=3364207 RepID=UPI00382F8753
MVVLTGCVPGTHDRNEENSVTLETAKADAQAMELEIASTIPAGSVVDVVQKPKGVLLSCDKTQHSWNGSTTVTLSAESDAELLIRNLETRMTSDERFESRNWVGPTGAFNVQLMSPTTAANYIVSAADERTIVINSGSECFTLPDDVYPGGTF